MNKNFMTENEIKAEWKLLGLALAIFILVAAGYFIVAPFLAPVIDAAAGGGL